MILNIYWSKYPWNKHMNKPLLSISLTSKAWKQNVIQETSVLLPKLIYTVIFHNNTHHVLQWQLQATCEIEAVFGDMSLNSSLFFTCPVFLLLFAILCDICLYDVCVAAAYFFFALLIRSVILCETTVLWTIRDTWEIWMSASSSTS